MIIVREIVSKLHQLRDPGKRRRIWTTIKLTPFTAYQIFMLGRKAKRLNKRLHLILHPGSLGDIVAAEPAAHSLVDPKRFLVWMVNPQYAGIVRNIPWLDAIAYMAGYTEWRLLRILFPHITASTLYPDGATCPWLGLSLSNPNITGITIENYYDSMSLQQVYSKIATGVGDNQAPSIYLSAGPDLETLGCKIGFSLSQDYAVVTCKSYDKDRSWPIEQFRETIRWLLNKTSLNLIEVGLEPVLEKDARICQLRGRLPIEQQAIVVSRAKFFLGVDSGFSHIANAVDVKAVIVMGEYKNWITYNPFSETWSREKAILVRSVGAIEKLDSQPVIDAIEKILF
jgi:heptosyltransferase-3